MERVGAMMLGVLPNAWLIKQLKAKRQESKMLMTSFSGPIKATLPQPGSSCLSQRRHALMRNAVQQTQSHMQAVHGTMSPHAVVRVLGGNVRVRETRYCPDCVGEYGFCQETHCVWQLHSINNESSSDQKVTLKRDDWVAALYEGKWYLQQVLEDDCLLNFMEGGEGRAATQSKFKWPRQKDELWIAHQDILCVVEKPITAGNSETFFTAELMQ